MAGWPALMMRLSQSPWEGSLPGRKLAPLRRTPSPGSGGLGGACLIKVNGRAKACTEVTNSRPIWSLRNNWHKKGLKRVCAKMRNDPVCPKLQGERSKSVTAENTGPRMDRKVKCTRLFYRGTRSDLVALKNISQSICWQVLW